MTTYGEKLAELERKVEDLERAIVEELGVAGKVLIKAVHFYARLEAAARAAVEAFRR